MPHGGGGGHSGGGFHGGSSFGGHSSSSYRTHYSRTPFHGARPFIYYIGFVPHVIYTDQDPTKRKPALLMPLIILGIMSVAEIGIISATSYHKPSKNTAVHDTEIVLRDETNVITDEEEAKLKTLFSEFHEKTGVMPSLMTAINSDWKYSYGDLTEYAIKKYNQQWPNEESHWLIVYSSEGGTAKTKWNYEIAQGYDSDEILYDGIKDRYFHPVLCKGLDGGLSVGESFVKAFETLVPELMKEDFYVEPASIAFTVFWQGIIIGLVVSTIYSYKKDKALQKATPIPEGMSVELKKCPKCGASYYKGTTDHCHKCGRSFLDDEFEGL